MQAAATNCQPSDLDPYRPKLLKCMQQRGILDSTELTKVKGYWDMVQNNLDYLSLKEDVRKTHSKEKVYIGPKFEVLSYDPWSREVVMILPKSKDNPHLAFEASVQACKVAFENLKEIVIRNFPADQEPAKVDGADRKKAKLENAQKLDGRAILAEMETRIYAFF